MTTISVINLMDGHIIVALMALGLVIWDVVSFPKLLRTAEFRKP